MRAPLAEPLELRPRPGPWPGAWAVLLGVLAAAALAVTALPAAVRLAAAFAIVVRLGLGLRRHGWPGPGPVRRAALGDGTGWRLEFADGRVVEGARLHHAWGLAGGPVIALEWRCGDGARHRAWVDARALHPADRRRLRVRLALA